MIRSGLFRRGKRENRPVKIDAVNIQPPALKESCPPLEEKIRQNRLVPLVRKEFPLPVGLQTGPHILKHFFTSAVSIRRVNVNLKKGVGFLIGEGSLGISYLQGLPALGKIKIAPPGF